MTPDRHLWLASDSNQWEMWNNPFKRVFQCLLALGLSIEHKVSSVFSYNISKMESAADVIGYHGLNGSKVNIEVFHFAGRRGNLCRHEICNRQKDSACLQYKKAHGSQCGVWLAIGCKSRQHMLEAVTNLQPCFRLIQYQVFMTIVKYIKPLWWTVIIKPTDFDLKIRKSRKHST